MEQKVLERQVVELKKQVELLEKDAAKYRLLKETAGFAIFTMNQYVFIDCNQMAEQIFGLSREEIIGKEPFVLSPMYQPDGSYSQTKAIELIDSTLQGKPRRFEWEHIRGDGSRFYADVSLNKVIVGDEAYIQVMLRDISSEKLAKERLENQNRIIRHLNKKYQRQNEAYEKLVHEIRQHQELNSAILSAINDGVGVFYTDRFIYINQQMLFMLGQNEETLTPGKLFDLLGYNFNELALPETHDAPLETWSEGHAQDKYFRIQVIAMSEPGLYMIHLTDYTQLKKIHKNIETSEFKFRSIFHSSTDGIILASANDYTIKEVNTTFIQSFGYSFEELIGVRIDTLIMNTSSTKFIQWLENNAGEHMNLTEFELFSAGGALFPVELGCRKIKLYSDNIFLIIVRDISYRKHFEQQLLQKTIEVEEQERKRIAANLHDELGPVLSSMKLYNNSLKNSDNEKLYYLSGQFEELITEALDTVRLLSNHLSPVSLYKGGIEVAVKKRLKAIEKFYDIHFSATLNEARFDEQVEINIYRIINELLNNTIKHAEASSITLKMAYAKTGLSIHYSDNGKGFATDLTEASNKGHGVGNIQGRLKSMNATFKFESEPGKGVSYDITVPANVKKSTN